MADVPELLPCPFCGGEAEVIRKHCRVVVLCPSAGPVCLTLQSESFDNDDAIAAWNTRAAPPAPIAEGVTCVAKPLSEDERKAAIDKWMAPPAMDREAVERKFWLIIREPGRVPDRKGPWPLEQTASILREFMAANPKSFIDYLTIGPDGSPYVDHGPEVLQMTDGRSMSTGRKHNVRVREAATAALSTLSADAIRQGEGMEERPFAHCCAEAGGRTEACDCANKNHGTAWFSTPASDASDGGKA